MVRSLWSREELILAINLYCKLPFGQFDQKNPEVVKLAHFIGRSPSAVAMKLSNFAALDSYHRSRGVKGLRNFSQGDKHIWEEFTSNWSHYGVESERLAQSIEADIPAEQEWEAQERPTEAERIVQVRIGQGFFRKVVLSSYNFHCCICAMPIPALLIASHIIPWREREDLRLNPHNGLCLCSLHDKAFDLGLIGVNADYRVRISPRVNQFLPNVSLSNGFEIYKDSTITLPTKFSPDRNLLDYHIQNYFIAE